MIKELPESQDNFLAFEITGKVSLDEEKVWIDRLDKVVSSYDEVSVLVILGESTSWGTWAGIEDIKWLFKNSKNLQKIAVVSESWVWKWLISIDSQFAKMAGVKEKHFEATHAQEAWQWLKGSEV